LALSAPSADQFLSGSFELARLTQPEHKVEFDAPVVLASAPAPQPRPAPIGEQAQDDSGQPRSASPRALLHEASYKTNENIGTREVPSKPVAVAPLAASFKSTAKPVTAAKPAPKAFASAKLPKAVDKSGLAAAHPSKTVDKRTTALAKPVTKPVRLAKNDPLAPLPDKRTSKPSGKSSKDLHPAR
jgi:hypothetical protein